MFKELKLTQVIKTVSGGRDYLEAKQKNRVDGHMTRATGAKISGSELGLSPNTSFVDCVEEEELVVNP